MKGVILMSEIVVTANPKAPNEISFEQRERHLNELERKRLKEIKSKPFAEHIKEQFSNNFFVSQLKIKNTGVSHFESQHLGIPLSQTATYIERISKSDDLVIEYDIEIWSQDKIEMTLDIQS